MLIQATGHAANDTTATVEVTLVPMSSPAILSNGDLTVQGNPEVTGTNGSVHSNAALLVGGSANIDGNATGSAGYTETGHPSIGGSSNGTAPPLPVPDVRAADYRNLADLILTAGGTMTDQGGTIICDASVDAQACENTGHTWVFSGAAGWRATSLGARADNRTFYAETDLTITGNIGTAGNPWNLTLIAEGSIDISGNGTIEANSPGLLFVTDRDLHLAGGKGQVGAEAQVLVREQAFLATKEMRQRPMADGDIGTEWQGVELVPVTAPGESIELHNCYLPPDRTLTRLWSPAHLPAAARTVVCADFNAYHRSWAARDDARLRKEQEEPAEQQRSDGHQRGRQADSLVRRPVQTDHRVGLLITEEELVFQVVRVLGSNAATSFLPKSHSQTKHLLHQILHY